MFFARATALAVGVEAFRISVDLAQLFVHLAHGLHPVVVARQPGSARGGFDPVDALVKLPRGEELHAFFVDDFRVDILLQLLLELLAFLPALDAHLTQ